jgi:copper(I)-binding protein
MKFLTLLTILIGFYSQNAFSNDKDVHSKEANNKMSQSVETKTVEIKDAKIRAPIPGMANTVGYMTLTNISDKDVLLVAAKSSISQKVEFHDHIMTTGVMKMVKLDDLTIKTNEIKTFETGGLHLMFIGLDHSQAMQKTVSVTFVFSDGSEQVGVFNIKSIHQHHH